MRHGFAAILIIGIIASILVLAGAFYLKQKNQSHSLAPMEELTVKACDLNEDGKCDSFDQSIFQESFGSKRGDKNYNPLADVDIDGVVTEKDRGILFPTTVPLSPLSSPAVETANWKTYRIEDSGDYYFDISIPANYSLKRDVQAAIARIYDETGQEVMYIYTYVAGGETYPGGKTAIDGVPYTVESSSKEIECLATLYATNLVLGTKPLFNIHVNCYQDKSLNYKADRLQEYTKIIQSIKFSTAWKKILLGEQN